MHMAGQDREGQTVCQVHRAVHRAVHMAVHGEVVHRAAIHREAHGAVYREVHGAVYKAVHMAVVHNCSPLNLWTARSIKLLRYHQQKS